MYFACTFDLPGEKFSQHRGIFHSSGKQLRAINDTRHKKRIGNQRPELGSGRKPKINQRLIAGVLISDLVRL